MVNVYPVIPGVQQHHLAFLHRTLGYQATEIIGTGKYGSVVRAKFDDPSGVLSSGEFAIKAISLARLRASMPNRRARDLATSLLIHNQHCVETKEVIQRSGVVFIIMDLAPNGSISRYVSDHPGTLNPRLVRVWCSQIGAALLYLHNQLLVAHRELSLGNILLDRHHRALLSGFSSLKANSERVGTHTRCGSGPFQAPEVFFGAQYCPMKADVWSYGMIIFALITRRFVCTESESTNRKLIMDRISRLPDKDLVDVLKMSLEPDVENRCSIRQLMNCKWLAAPFMT